ncbi:chemokine-like factor [Sminthopsis crassicaudata]|uniref:chemokine-like factor n=1 Tax=Sminthopsis crassicaudata TaxID=9301 RepID=UPI003D688CED
MDKLKWSKGLRIRLRAQGRLKVHPKMAIAAVHYLVSGPGMLKITRMLFVLGAAISFIIAPAHESYIAILLLECCIVLSFIIIYVLGLHHLLVCILWPAFDILNCLLTAGFLIIVGILVLWEEGTDEYIISGAACCFMAAGLCVLEVSCQGGSIWYKKWKEAVKEKMLAVNDVKKESSEFTKEKAVAEELVAKAVAEAATTVMQSTPPKKHSSAK